MSVCVFTERHAVCSAYGKPLSTPAERWLTLEPCGHLVKRKQVM